MSPGMSGPFFTLTNNMERKQMTTTTKPRTERVTLYCREGTSDKVYQISIEPRRNLFVVNFTFGRRGGTLQTGSKTRRPVDHETARKTYEKLVREKKAKGYTQGLEGTPCAHVEAEVRETGILPQLLNPVGDGEAARLLQDPDWCMQEKMDGRRLLLKRSGGTITAINRRGLETGLLETLREEALRIPGDWVLDGENVGDNLHAFDLLEQDGVNLRTRPCLQRLAALETVLRQPGVTRIRRVPVQTTTEGKTRLYGEIREAGREGVVFKRLDAPYSPGRPASGGTQLKHKFHATCSAVVAAINAQRSVELRLLNAQGWNPVGNVTIPANAEIPEVGQVVEVRYLHALRQSNALQQPVWLGVRGEIEQHECVLSQLKYKPLEP